MSANTNSKHKIAEGRLLKIIKGTHESEKASRLSEASRQYVFNVITDATKREIKYATEHLFDVEVDSVCVCNVKGKQRRFKQKIGKTNGLKKAYVRLKEGSNDIVGFVGNE